MFKKKIFLFLTIITAVLCIVSCTNNGEGVVRMNFKEAKYEVRMQEELELKPVVKSSNKIKVSEEDIVYKSLDESIARYVDGVVIPVSMGTTRVQAYYNNDPEVCATAEITVKKAVIPTLEIEEEIQMLKGSKHQLAYKLVKNYSDAKVAFSVEASSVVSVTEEGLVEAKAVGEASIKVTVSDAEESYEKQVRVVVVESDFAITYDTDGGELPEGATDGYSALELPTLLPVPTKVGYEFTGWLLGEEVVEALPAGTYGDVSVKACWEVIQYAITYSDEAEGNPATYTVEDEVVLQDASKAGYEFKGWTLDGEPIEEIKKGTTGELNLVALFEVITYSITYNVEVEGNPTTYTVEDEVVLLGKANEGYEYKGWKLDETVITKIEKGTTGDLSLEISCPVIQYTITYSDVVEGNPTTYTVEDEVVLKEASKERFAFKGWTLDGEYVEKIEKGTTGNLTLTAVFEQTTFEVTYELNGGKFDVYSSLEDIAADFVNDFNTFAGTSITHVSEYWAQSSKSSFWKDATYNAKWKWMIELLIPYSKAQGRDTQYLTALIQETPTVYGYATQNVMMYLLGINNDIWNETYKDTCGGLSSKWTAVDCTSEEIQNSWKALFSVENTFTRETELELPIPTREGYTFLGWYLGETLVTKIEKGTASDVTVVAKWEIIPVYHEISYDVNEGVLPEDAVTKFVEGTGLETLPTPTREGYAFLGWYEGETKVESIPADRTTDVELVAKWEKLLTIEEFTEEFLADWNYYGNDTATAENFHKPTASSIKVAFANAEMLAKYKWLFEYALVSLAEANAANITNGVFTDTKEVLEGLIAGDTDIISGSTHANGRTLIRHWLHGLMNKELPEQASYYTSFSTDFSKEENQASFLAAYKAYKDAQSAPVEHEISYDVNEGVLPEDAATKFVEGTGLETLPTPTREGYDFLGWYEGETKVESIPADRTTDVELVAKWAESAPKIETITVGPDETYKTLDEAIAVAKPGAVIIILAGTYTGGTISVANVTLVGPNKGISPVNGTRVDEAVFTGDIVVSADGVTIDGIKLTGNGRVKGGENGLENLTVNNVLISESSITGQSDAPVYLYTTAEDAEYKNIVISNMANIDSTGARPMILYGAHINGITIKDSKFVGPYAASSYNDGIKFDNTANWGVKGEVNIVSNHIEGYAQYAIWFRQYAEGTYNILNNTFVHNGQTAKSHAAASFITYVGEANGTSNINFQYNVVNNSYMALRLDATDGRTSENQIVNVNYNKILNCAATYYVKNSNANVSVDATNNWYDNAPKDSSFLNATYKPYYENESDVPAYSESASFNEIIYQLNGGTLPENTPNSFESATGLSTLPTPTNGSMIFVGWKLNGEFVTSIAAGTETSVTLEAVWREDAIYVSKNGESYAVATIAEAIAAAKEGDKIIILAGEWEESFTVSVANLTIAGANQGVNPNTSERSAETVLKGVITVKSAAKNLKLDGLAFTGNAKIKNSANADAIEGLVLTNSKAYDMAITTAWVLNRYVSDAFLELKVSTGSTKNITVTNNLFDNVGNINVLVNRGINLSVDGNVFKNFGSDAIRIEGGYSGGLVYFTNNHFEQETAGHGNNAIFTYSISSSSCVTNVVIKGNTFVKVGETTTTNAPYNGTISSHLFQECEMHWTITDNIFDHCSNIMWLRNNGATSSTWSCTVENNQFLGLPLNYYFGSYRGSDKESTNPHLAVFGENYYEDNDGNVITDLSAYADKFNHLSTYGTASASKSELGKGEKLEFWTISYELNGGTCANLVTAYNITTDTIVLPTPTWNIYHEFVRWTLNGETITEIAKGTKGDLVIVAEWKEVEGDPLTIEFELNGGNWSYSSFDDISLDLLSDYNAWGGTNYTQENLPTNAWSNINLHTFFYSEGMKEKWSWLASWLSENGGSANKKGCAQLLVSNDATSFAAVNSNYPYAVSYEFRAIMFGAAFTSNANYKTSDYSVAELREKVWDTYLPTVSNTLDTTVGKNLTLPTPKKPYFTFAGWYDNAEFTGEAITEILTTEETTKYYAKFVDLNPITNINILNGITSAKRYVTLQLEWEVLPAAAMNKKVKFISSDTKVATVDSNGLVEFLTEGTVTIKVVSLAYETVYGEMVVNVYTPEHIQGEFVTNSYVVVNETIEVNATLVGGTGEIEWKSLNSDIATVEDGVVKGLKAGTATIVASKVGDESVKFEFKVIVIESEEEGVAQFLREQNNANIFLRSQLGIGSGGYVYYSDILSSVSKLYFAEYVVDTTYYIEEASSSQASNHAGLRTGALEFITVHYTGNMSASAGGKANANYFYKNTANVSIHYVTGNDGIYYVYDEKYNCKHAGDGTSTEFEWYATSVLVKDTDPERPVVTITENSKFAINGTETTISCPSGYAKYYDPTTKSMVVDTSNLIHPTDSKYLTDLGPAVKVVDGQYYIGRTWWCNSQVAEGRVCSLGGNLNSIGIESACNEGSDLWMTWQKTAQLVSTLMIKYNLDIERVKGHNFFSAKDCPQPMLENDDEIWWEFIDLVKAEYESRTTYEGWSFSMVSDNTDIVDNTGRVIAQPEYDTCVTYTVTATNGEEVKTIKLSSIVPGIYRNLAQGER